MFNIFTLNATMNTYLKSKQLYIADHLSKKLLQPERRLNALSAIERIIQANSPEILQSDNLFKKFDKNGFLKQYHEWKGKPLSGAEKSVIVGIFKLSK